MFASDEEGKAPSKPKPAAPAAAAAAAAAPPAAAAAQAGVTQPPAAAPPAKRAQVEDTTDYGSWPVKELRRFLLERGVVSMNRRWIVQRFSGWQTPCL